jgi:hypothetical protein
VRRVRNLALRVKGAKPRSIVPQLCPRFTAPLRFEGSGFGVGDLAVLLGGSACALQIEVFAFDPRTTIGP